MTRNLTMLLALCALLLSLNGAVLGCSARSVDELYRHCGLIGAACGSKLGCEGEPVRISGVMDWSNVFFKADYPQLPYEKFMVRDVKSARNIEVWVTPESAGEVYLKLRKQRNAPGGKVIIQGTVSGFDMAIAGECGRGIRIELDSPDGIDFL